MRPLLLDEGLPATVANALRLLELDVWSIGSGGAPPTGSDDETNCEWCASRDAVLVTNDRGKKDPAISHALGRHRVGALFVHNDLRHAAPHELARALLVAEHRIDELSAGRKLLRHRLKPNGRLEKR